MDIDGTDEETTVGAHWTDADGQPGMEVERDDDTDVDTTVTGVASTANADETGPATKLRERLNRQDVSGNDTPGRKGRRVRQGETSRRVARAAKAPTRGKTKADSIYARNIGATSVPARRRQERVILAAWDQNSCAYDAAIAVFMVAAHVLGIGSRMPQSSRCTPERTADVTDPTSLDDIPSVRNILGPFFVNYFSAMLDRVDMDNEDESDGKRVRDMGALRNRLRDVFVAITSEEHGRYACLSNVTDAFVTGLNQDIGGCRVQDSWTIIIQPGSGHCPRWSAQSAVDEYAKARPASTGDDMKAPLILTLEIDCVGLRPNQRNEDSAKATMATVRAVNIDLKVTVDGETYLLVGVIFTIPMKSGHHYRAIVLNHPGHELAVNGSNRLPAGVYGYDPLRHDAAMGGAKRGAWRPNDKKGERHETLIPLHPECSTKGLTAEPAKRYLHEVCADANRVMKETGGQVRSRFEGFVPVLYVYARSTGVDTSVFDNSFSEADVSGLVARREARLNNRTTDDGPADDLMVRNDGGRWEEPPKKRRRRTTPAPTVAMSSGPRRSSRHRGESTRHAEFVFDVSSGTVSDEDDAEGSYRWRDDGSEDGEQTSSSFGMVSL